MPERSIKSFALSMRARLVLVTLGTCLAMLAIGSVAMYAALTGDDDEMRDARLATLASVVLQFSEHEIAEVEAEGRAFSRVADFDAAFGSLYLFQVWDPKGRLLLRSSKAPAGVPIAPLDMVGFRDVTMGGQRYRLLGIVAAQGSPILQLAESLGERGTDLALVSRRFIVFLLLPGLLIAAVAVRLMREPSRALAQVAQLVDRRGPLDLTPIDPGRAPPEIAAMSLAINALFERVSGGIVANQMFAASAAHELRGPLAGLRAQAQLAQLTTDANLRAQALQQVMEAVDSSAHLIDQLLDLSRVEAIKETGRQVSEQTLDLAEIVEQEIDRLDAKAVGKGVVLLWQPPDSGLAPMIGHAGGLGLMASNLIRNAVQFTPVGGRVRVALTAGTRVDLTVEDSGPGITPDRRAAAFERFNRLGRTDGGGAGLGLAIVAHVVQLHDGEIQLGKSDLGGLQARVTLPRGIEPAPASIDDARDSV